MRRTRTFDRIASRKRDSTTMSVINSGQRRSQFGKRTSGSEVAPTISTIVSPNTEWRPINSQAAPGAFTTIIKDKIKVDELATKFQEFLTKEKKDKLLHTISAEYDGKKTFVLKEEKEWNTKQHKKGTYAVTIGIK